MIEEGLSTFSLQERYVLGNYGRFPLALERGEGTEVWSEEGKRYLDFGTGIAVCSLGHSHPEVTEAIREQAGRLLHCSNLYATKEQGLLAQHLVETVMERAGKVFFCNSGAEANELLIKLARRFGSARGEGKHEIITFDGSFHGRTMAGISATAQKKISAGFEPLLPGFVHLPFADLVEVKRAVTDQTAAILLEPVQGEGGIRPFEGAFLKELEALAKSAGALLLFDEVQCGVGRLGENCGWRALAGAEGVNPDAVSWAKGMGGGIPIGAVWMTDEGEVSSLMGPGSHGTTYGGGPLVARCARTVLEIIERDGLAAHAQHQGKRICQAISQWKSPWIEEVRGLGLMLGIVLSDAWIEARKQRSDGGGTGTPAVQVVKELMERGLLTVPAGERVVRILPPLNVKPTEVDEALSLLRSQFAEMSES
ncbi:MAG: acetylornithine/succinylornithine family transaminase [Verrucomicrobiota bacterium]